MPRLTPGPPASSVRTTGAQPTAPIIRRHWQVVELVAQGTPVAEAARLVGYTPAWARTIVRRYHAEGPAGLGDRRRHNPGRAPLLSPDLRAELAVTLGGPAPGGGTWTSVSVAAWMSARLGRPVAPARGWEALKALGFTPHRLR